MQDLNEILFENKIAYSVFTYKNLIDYGVCDSSSNLANNIKYKPDIYIYAHIYF